MPERLMDMRMKLLLLVSASVVAISSAHAQSNRNAGFLIEAPILAPNKPAPAQPAREAAPPLRPSSEAVAIPERRATQMSIKPIDAEEGGADETALRYYAAQNQMKRVAAEIERLRRLYPSWRPPETLVEPASTSTEDEQPLWDLFGADRIAELRAAIEERKQSEPEWRPSKDLLDKIARKEMRQRLMGFWRDGNIDELLNSVNQDGFGGDRADVDLQWTVAEAYARMKRTDDALAIYQSLMRTLIDSNERMATIRKAMDTLRISDVEPLFASLISDEQGRSEIATLANDITRARISAYLHDERAERIPDAEFKSFQEHVRGLDDPNQIGLVAWYYLKNKSGREALEWFKLSLERGGDAMIAHGLANALRELGLKREAEEVAFAWRSALINNSILYIDVLETELTQPSPPFIEPERLMRYAQVTMDMASGEGAQALGWYAYNTCQYEAAREWFERAVAWYPKEATVYGLVLASQRTKRSKDVFELANRYDGLFPKVIGVIFPDGYQRPPSPCDMVAAGSRAPAGFRPPQMATGAAPAAQRHAFGGGAFQAPASQQQAWQSSFQQPALTPVANDQMPKFARGEFPAAVDPENNRRYASSGLTMGRPLQVNLPPATQTLLRAEQPRPAPLVARRVQGVGSMPYERWGFSLLPGANGQMTPDAAHSAQTAPVGTVWASEPTGSRAAETYTDPYQAMQVISAAPRVPLPSTMRMMPTGPIAPVFMRGAELRPGLDVDMTATGSLEGGDRLKDSEPEELPPMSQLPDDYLPIVVSPAAPHGAVRKEETAGGVVAWRPQLTDVLVQLGRFSPQARLGCPFTSLESVRAGCLATVPPPRTGAPE
jgi:tetratricopeptide (TPR) repeat protein